MFFDAPGKPTKLKKTIYLLIKLSKYNQMERLYLGIFLLY